MENALYNVRGLLEGNGSIPVYITLDAYQKLLAEKKKMNNIPVSKVLTSILEKYDQNQVEIKNWVLIPSLNKDSIIFSFYGSIAQPGSAPDS